VRIDLRVVPGQRGIGWSEFGRSTDPYSIALDGYVEGPPAYDLGGPRVSFNHHEGVSRLDTRATCAQVLMALRQGLLETFRDPAGEHRATVYVNDCDEDVCLSVFLLRHPYFAVHAVNPILNRLVAMEDALDSTGGAYPFPADLAALQEMAWVFEPYHRLRVSGGLGRMDPVQYRGVIDDVGARIIQLLAGRGGTVDLDLRYDVASRGTGWALVHEFGAQARTAMYASGIRAFVSIRPALSHEWKVYTVGRMSPFVRFDVPGILAVLTAAEREAAQRHASRRPVDWDTSWGGSDVIGGSPRGGGSLLLPDDVFRIVEEYQTTTQPT
jgi:hypothetical protein